MRLFVALTFSQPERDQILRIQRQLKRQCTAGNFTRPENLHLTLAFLGDIPPEQIPTLRDILTETASKAHPFSLSYDQLGHFPGKGKEKLWYLGCETPPALNALVQNLHSHLIKSGFSLEDRAFLPHVTLGRRCLSEEKPEIIFPPISAEFSTMELMMSAQIAGLLTYVPIFSVKFRK